MDSFFKNVKDSKYLNEKQNTFENINIVLEGNYFDRASFLLRLKYKDYNEYNKYLSAINNNMGLNFLLDYTQLILNYRYINIKIIIRNTVGADYASL